MRRDGYIVFTACSGEALPNVPAQLDLLTGAALPVSRLDGGPIDRALRHHGDGFRAGAVYHARKALQRPGEQHVGYDGLEERLGMSRTYRVRLADPAATDAVVDRLRSIPAVESAAVQSLAVTPFAADALAPAPPPVRRGDVDAHDLVAASTALAIEPGDERVTVACVDTGVSLGHAELQRKLLAGYDTVDLGLGRVGGRLRLVGDSRGHDFSPLDAVGHGTHVAAIIGAQGWRMPKGIAGRALVLPIRVLAAARPSGTKLPVGVGALPDIDAGMKVAVDLGADVINMSFGTRADNLDAQAPTPHAAVIAYATRHGCVLIAASGNSGRRERFFPAALPEVIAVGSVDQDGRRSSFSTWGDHVAIAAPGEQVRSADRRGYRAASGTSFAAPFVAGAAGLLLALARRQGRRLTPADVREALLRGATPLGSSPNPETGHGRLNAAASLRLLRPTENLA
jgi:subtilisin family serine protease